MACNCACNRACSSACNCISECVAEDTVRSESNCRGACLCEKNGPCDTAANIQAMDENRCPCPCVDCTPIVVEPTPEEILIERNYQPCTDPNGVTTLYPEVCRNTFWPSFAHPRWLCCSALYCQN